MHLDTESWGTGRKNPRTFNGKTGDSFFAEGPETDKSDEADESTGNYGEAIAYPTKPSKRFINKEKSIDVVMLCY